MIFIFAIPSIKMWFLLCKNNVGDIFEDDGTLKDPSSRLLSQLPAMMAQLEWFAIACKNQREAAGTP